MVPLLLIASKLEEAALASKGSEARSLPIHHLSILRSSMIHSSIRYTPAQKKVKVKVKVFVCPGAACMKVSFVRVSKGFEGFGRISYTPGFDFISTRVRFHTHQR